MKKKSMIFLLFLMIFMLGLKVRGENEESYVEKRINIMTQEKSILEQNAIVKNGISYISARTVAEVFELRLTWIENERKVLLKDHKDTFEIFPIYGTIYLNGEPIDGSSDAFIQNHQTYIPIRRIGELLGYHIEWVGEWNGILVSPDREWVEGYLNELQATWIKAFFEGQEERPDFITIKLRGEYDYQEGWLEDTSLLYLDILLGDGNPVPDISAKKLDKIKGFKIMPIGDGIARVVFKFEEQLEYFLYREKEAIHLLLGIDKQEGDRLRSRLNNRGGLERDSLRENLDENIDVEILGGMHLIPFNYDPGNIMIVIDPGHGGSEPGAVSGGVYEKDLNLDISLKLNEILMKEGFKTHMTRKNDSFVSLKDRATIANNVNAEIFISVHHNAFNASSNGTETLFLSKKNDSSKKLARNIQKELVESLSFVDRGIIERPGLAVLRQTNMPAVMVEVGFMTNQRELEQMIKEETKVEAALAIYRGILGYFSEVQH
jgi:N-acetylmuramoyl-L-alanine amidase